MALTISIGAKFRIYVLLILSLAVFASSRASSNEMPLSGITANGIVVKDEKNIQIEKEVLHISRLKIEVDYVFNNYSDQDIVTEVAFPIPSHSYDPPDNINYPVHKDFAAEVNGKKVVHKELIRALQNGQDYFDLLTKMKITVADFGNEGKFIEKLNRVDKKKLLDLGLIGNDGYDRLAPKWSIEKYYYWSQSFPRHATTTVKISYTPNTSTRDYLYLDKAGKDSMSDILCLKEDDSKILDDKTYQVQIVNYILTSANYWKQPIKDFKLIIDSPTPDYYKELVSTCYMKNKVQKINIKRYEISIKDYIPNEEIDAIFVLY
jgi:hypothetical protein